MIMPALLNNELLKELPPHLKGPSYRPSEHGASIVHLGIGAFHKAHQAVYTDDLLSACGGDWRINAVSLRSPTVRDQLAPQDYLYTVTEKHNGKSEHRVIAAINKVLVAPENPLSVIELLADIKTKVVTCSITEKATALLLATRFSIYAIQTSSTISIICPHRKPWLATLLPRV